jgi:hypothetical protein
MVLELILAAIGVIGFTKAMRAKYGPGEIDHEDRSSHRNSHYSSSARKSKYHNYSDFTHSISKPYMPTFGKSESEEETRFDFGFNKSEKSSFKLGDFGAKPITFLKETETPIWAKNYLKTHSSSHDDYLKKDTSHDDDYCTRFFGPKEEKSSNFFSPKFDFPGFNLNSCKHISEINHKDSNFDFYGTSTKRREQIDDISRRILPPLPQRYERVYSMSDMLKMHERPQIDKNDCIPIDLTPLGRMVPVPFFHNVLHSSPEEYKAGMAHTYGLDRPVELEPNRELMAIRNNPLPEVDAYAYASQVFNEPPAEMLPPSGW